VPVWERAPRRRRQPRVLHRGVVVHAVELVELPCKLVVVVRGALVDVEVDAVHRHVAEGAEHVIVATAEVCVPQVVCDVGGHLGGQRGVGLACTADREEDEDALGLAVLDVGADAVQRVAGEVEPVETVTEDVVEGDDDGVRTSSEKQSSSCG
jgi:hypothetical protein